MQIDKIQFYWVHRKLGLAEWYKSSTLLYLNNLQLNGYNTAGSVNLTWAHSHWFIQLAAWLRWMISSVEPHMAVLERSGRLNNALHLIFSWAFLPGKDCIKKMKPGISRTSTMLLLFTLLTTKVVQIQEWETELILKGEELQNIFFFFQGKDHFLLNHSNVKEMFGHVDTHRTF